MEFISRIGMDTSKHIFQLYGVNAAEQPVLRKKLRRRDMVAFFERLAPTVIAIEACGASHHWARLLQSFGHGVKMIAPRWLDMAESELGVLSTQCLDRRIPDNQTIIDEIAAWEDDRNVNHAKADWQFTTADARSKLKHLYPSI